MTAISTPRFRYGGGKKTEIDARVKQIKLQIEETTAIQIPAQIPARQIAQNAGEDGSVIVGKIPDHGTYDWGYDAQTGEYGDLTAKGMIDPTKVVRCALQDAASVAGLLITTEAMIAEKPKTVAPVPTSAGMDY